MHFPTWLTWYKKPEYRDIKEYATEISAGRRTHSPEGRRSTSIPTRLKLERILENKTCSPMSLYDFYMYLKYIEFSPENLEFYIWYKNYETNYAKTAAQRPQQVLGEKDNGSFTSVSTSSDPKLDVKLPEVDLTNATGDPEAAKTTLAQIARLVGGGSKRNSAQNGAAPEAANDTLAQIAQLLAQEPKCEIPKKGGPAVCRPPVPNFGILPGVTPDPDLRAELDAVVATFLVPGAEKELNIPPHMREEALRHLQAGSADPKYLRPVAEHVYLLLKNCSHRNFVRLGVSNGTFETVCMATGLGIVLTCVGFLLILLRAFVPFIGAHTRWDAFAPWPFWWLGISLILSGLRGSCFFLLLFTRRQPLPWERFDDSASMLTKRSGIMRFFSRLMIFDRKVKVKDEHLRRVQYKIVMQSLIGGAVFASLCVLLFIFLPCWRETVQYR